MAPCCRSRRRHRKDSNRRNVASKGTQFFKIILPDVIRDCQLGIPKEFVRNFGKNLSTNASLELPNGGVCSVRLRKADGSIWFQSGWQEFVDYYSVGLGYFLVFKYVGNSHFHVFIFDMSACEIDYPVDAHNLEEPNYVKECQVPRSEEREEEEEEDDDVQILAEFPPCQTRTKSSQRRLPSSLMMRFEPTSETEASDHIQELDPLVRLTGIEFGRSELANKSIEHNSEANCSSQESIGGHDFSIEEGDKDSISIAKRLRRHSNVFSTRRRSVTKLENATALEAAEAFESENLFFIVVMRRSYVSGKYCLNIPVDFVRRYLSMSSKTIVLQDSNRRTWTVHTSFTQNYAKLNRGWDAFVCDSNVEEGDACVFELVNMGGNELKVVVFRTSEIAGHQ